MINYLFNNIIQTKLYKLFIKYNDNKILFIFTVMNSNENFFDLNIFRHFAFIISIKIILYSLWIEKLIKYLILIKSIILRKTRILTLICFKFY